MGESTGWGFAKNIERSKNEPVYLRIWSRDKKFSFHSIKLSQFVHQIQILSRLNLCKFYLIVRYVWCFLNAIAGYKNALFSLEAVFIILKFLLHPVCKYSSYSWQQATKTTTEMLSSLKSHETWFVKIWKWIMHLSVCWRNPRLLPLCLEMQSQLVFCIYKKLQACR